jgi:hypothetical protein
MKMNIRKTILILFICLPALLLSGCDDVDWDLLEIYFESWAEENNLYANGKYKPENVVIKAVEDTIGDITNAEENIQFDGIDVVRNIERADELANEAINENDFQKMHTAIELRPKDWTLREQNAVLLSAHSNYSDSNDSYIESNNLLKEQIQQGGDCIKLRTEQLEYREVLLSDNINKCVNTPGCDSSYLGSDQSFAQEELFQIYDTGVTPFCK